MPIDPQNLFVVRDKAAIITGAAGGIGTVLVAGFAALGARVLAVDIVDPKALPAGVAFHRADLRDPVAVAGIADAAAARLGAVDILINNAGLGEMVRAEEMTLEVWNNTLATNLTGSFLLSQAVGRGMIARRSGKIINIGSRCGLMGMPFSAAYNASKEGIAALTRTLAATYISSWGISGSHRDADPEEERLFARTIPLGRVSEPDDMLGAAVFLASPAANYITGAALFVDGGNYMADGIGTEYRDHGLKRMGVIG